MKRYENIFYLCSMRCLNCKKDVDQTPGKRRKLYCSGKCRTAHCRKGKPKIKSKRGPGRPKKQTPAINQQEIQAKIAEVKEQIKDMPVLYGPIKEVLQEASKENTKLGIEAMIASVKAEKIPSNRDTPMGRKSWVLDQKKRIQELENLLKEYKY